jgi:hypothetical protein
LTPHWLFSQVAVACDLDGHTLSQAPQLFGSLLVSAQAPLHSMNGETQAKSQVPRTQVGVALAGGMHTVSQSPQCAVLVVKSTQEPPHACVLPAQLVPHLPAAHTSPASQALAQPPQCAVSDARSTQAPLHSS